ncbi:MAG: hypothetical protein KDA78_08225 [Planctomycetaceae bacterium]|nr:hypothetical protein [Planctomycetaceae bacterium]
MKQFGMVVVVVLSAMAGRWVVQNVVFAPPSFDAQLVKVCSEFNKNLPMEVDQITRLDTTAPGPGKRITYFYTLHSIDESDITEEKKALMEQGVRQQVAQAADLKSFRDNHVAMSYIYRLTDGREVFKFTIEN